MGLKGVLAAMLAIATTIVTASSRRDIIDLPTGFFPEGIALAEGWTVYVGSFGTGSIWKGDISTGEGKIVVEDAGGMVTGMAYDKRSGYLYVCGGFTGRFRIYDTWDFSIVADYNLAGSNVSTVVNDVVLTDTAAYITDSMRAQFYMVPLEKNSGKLQDGEDTVAVTIPLGSEFTMVEGTNANGIEFINANGIEATDDGKTLIIVNMASGELYTVDPQSGEAAQIDLGGVLVQGGDGLVLRKNTLWIVRNTLIAGNSTEITEVSLSADLTCGSVLPRALMSEFFDEPATAVRKGNSLYTVTAKFFVAPEDVATTSYEIVRTDRDGGEVVCSPTSE